MRRDPPVGQYAGAISRAVAFGIDVAIISLTVLVVAALTLTIEGFFPGRIFAGVRFAITVATEVIDSVFAIVYPIAFWAVLGETPGDMLLGLRIVRTDGRRMNLRCALLRYVGCLLAALPLFLGFLWILADDRRQGWHDKIASTYVLYTVHGSVRQSIAHRPPAKRAHG